MTTAGRGLAALCELAAAVVEAETTDAVVDALVAAAGAGVGVDQIHVTEISQDAAVGRARTVGFQESGPVADEYVQVIDERPSGVGKVVATREVLHVPDTAESTELRRDYVSRFNAASVLFVPLMWSGEVRYVLILIRHEKRPFEPEERELARALANQAAAGLARQEAERRSADQHDRDSALARAARVLNASLDLQTVLETLAAEADLAVGGDMAGVYLGDGVRGGTATAGHNTPPDWLGYVMKPGEGVGGQVLATGRPAISNAYQSDVRLPANPGLRRLQTAVAVPMAWGGELKGALSVGFMRMRRVNQQDLRTLEAIADLATVACRNAEAFQRIESAARMDSLTGLLDHGALQARLREEIERSRREGSTLALMIVELDDFEALNVHAGHLHGDDVLCRVAAVLRRNFRPYDALARYGGDQFAVVMPRCTSAHAAELAERLRETLVDQVAVPSGAPRISCSVGVVGWDGSIEAGELLDLALAAVRDAKHAGGGRVHVV